MADDRHVGNVGNATPVSRRIWTKVGWSHLIMSPTCPMWCGCHFSGRYLATAHWTFSSYRRLVAERTNQYATKMKCGRKTANINTKNFEVLSLLKHQKQPKLFDFFYSRPLGCGCNESHILLRYQW